MLLTAFYQSYLLIAGVCALFCLLVNLYNFLFHITKGRRDRRLRREARRLSRRLISPRISEERSMLHLQRVLRKNANLRALYEALDRLGWDRAEDIPEDALRTVRQALNRNMSVYRKRGDPQRALAATLGNRVGLRTRTFQRFLMENMERAPMYLRIVAMRGCALQRDEEVMLQTVERISGQGSAYGVKLISDILILYRGDKEELFTRMWERMGDYSENVCCAVLGVMTMEGMAVFAPSILSLLQDSDMYLECRIAAIKYFGAVRYPPAESVLAGLLSMEDWEYAAVAARALSRYDCADAGEELLRALASSNWYVRYNSAMTLAARRPDQVDRALGHEDRYARDIMRYALSTGEERIGVNGVTA